MVARSPVSLTLRNGPGPHPLRATMKVAPTEVEAFRVEENFQKE